MRVIKEQTGLTTTIASILYTWTFMLGAECNLGLAYLCDTEMSEDSVVLIDDLRDYKWIEADEFSEYIHNKRMLEDMDRAELY